MVKACLDAICQSQEDLQLILRYFEVWLLKLEAICQTSDAVVNANGRLGRRSAFMNADSVLRCRGCSQGSGSALSKRLQTQLRALQRLAPYVYVQESRAVPASIHREMAELTHQLIGRVLENNRAWIDFSMSP